jgi:hypothetical protein
MDGTERARIPDIPVSSAASSIAYQESITAQKAAATYSFLARVVAADEAGRERVIGEYTFHDTRSASLPKL